MFARQLLDGLEGLRLVVAYHMSLIENAIVPADTPEEFNIILHDFVTGYHQRVILHHFPQPTPQAQTYDRSVPITQRNIPLTLSWATFVSQGSEMLPLNKPDNFLCPMPDQCRRADNQRDQRRTSILQIKAHRISQLHKSCIGSSNLFLPPGFSVVITSYDADGLQRLSQAHIITEDSV